MQLIPLLIIIEIKAWLSGIAKYRIIPIKRVRLSKLLGQRKLIVCLSTPARIAFIFGFSTQRYADVFRVFYLFFSGTLPFKGYLFGHGTRCFLFKRSELQNLGIGDYTSYSVQSITHSIRSYVLYVGYTNGHHSIYNSTLQRSEKDLKNNKLYPIGHSLFW